MTRVIRDVDDRVIACELEAVINHRTRVINWQELKDDQRWLMRWKYNPVISLQGLKFTPWP